MLGLRLFLIEFLWVEFWQLILRMVEIRKVRHFIVLAKNTHTAKLLHAFVWHIQIKILNFYLSHIGWPVYAQLLVDLFKFLSSFLRNAELSKPVHRLYRKYNIYVKVYFLLPCPLRFKSFPFVSVIHVKL